MDRWNRPGDDHVVPVMRFRPRLGGLRPVAAGVALAVTVPRGILAHLRHDTFGVVVYALLAVFLVVTFGAVRYRVAVEVDATTVRVRTMWRRAVVFHRGATRVQRHRWDAALLLRPDLRHALRLVDTVTGVRRTVDLRLFTDADRLERAVSDALDDHGPTIEGPPDRPAFDGISGPPPFREP